jgi:hypothetical protein
MTLQQLRYRLRAMIQPFDQILQGEAPPQDTRGVLIYVTYQLFCTASIA